MLMRLVGTSTSDWIWWLRQKFFIIFRETEAQIYIETLPLNLKLNMLIKFDQN